MQISYLNSNLFLFCSYLLDEGKQETATLTFYSGGEKKTEKEKEENIWRRSLQKLSRILKSLGFGFGLETFANFWRVSVSVLGNSVSEKKSWFRKIWYRKKSLGNGFGQNFCIVIQWFRCYFYV